MSKDFEATSQLEISRIVSMGWKDWSEEARFLRIPSQKLEKNIFFPQQAYDPNTTNEVASGVWAESRADVILTEMNRNGIDLLWEIGAGDGNVAIPLRKNGKTVIAVEPLRTGADSLANYGFITYFATLEDLNLPSNVIRAVGMFDVLEHIEFPAEVLQEVKRILIPNGKILITVPANKFLFSDFDISIGHFTRYSKSNLRKLLEDNDFKIDKIYYFFFLLVLPAIFLRAIPYRLGRRREFAMTANANKSQGRIMRFLAPLLRAAFKIEAKLPLPTGLSLFVIASKIVK